MEFETIKEIISEQFRVDADTITMDTSFIDDLGADSLDVAEIIMAIEESFDIEVDDDALESIKTVGDAVSFLKSNN